MDVAQVGDCGWIRPIPQTLMLTMPLMGATSSAYTPVGDDRGMHLKARVTYTDRTRDEDNDPDE